MNWAKENKFLTVFIVVMLIGIGALGYEFYSANSAFDEATDGYTKASTEYNRLRHLVPFPSKQNLDAYKLQEDDAGKIITAFEADLAKKQFPVETITPAGFQDKLKASVTAIRAKAQGNGIALPEKGFYLGFEPYETKSPSDDAAAPLFRELKAIEWVMNQYLSHTSSQMKQMVALTRANLPEEEKPGRGTGAGGGGRGGSEGGFGGRPGGGGGPGGRGSGGGGTGGGSAGAGSGRRNNLVQYHPFDVTVLCKQQALMDVLNTITSANAPQFYVLRQIRIKNSGEKAPSRTVPDAGKPEEKDAVRYIVGEEWLEVSARWEVVDFASPSEAASGGPESSTSKPGAGSKATPAPKSTPAPAAPAATLTPSAVVTPPSSLAPAATPAPSTSSTPAPAPAAAPAPKSTPAAPQP